LFSLIFYLIVGFFGFSIWGFCFAVIGIQGCCMVVCGRRWWSAFCSGFWGQLKLVS